MNKFYIAVAQDMDMPCDDDFVSAIEGACVTQPEYANDPAGCHQRINGALEEIFFSVAEEESSLL